MINSNEVNSIVCMDRVKIDQSMDTVCYIINYKNGTQKNVFANIPRYRKPRKSDEIVSFGNNFVNGFKVVKLNNNHYSYISELDNKLVSFEYDIAFDFNEYGLAMVGKAGSVTWINKDFEYLDSKGNISKENNDSWKNYNGWQAMFDFNDGVNPLSRMYCGKADYGRTVYVDANHSIKKFYQYDGDISKKVFRDSFYTGSDFNSNQYAIADNYILYSKGFCISKEDIIKLCLEEGFIDLLFDDAEFKYNTPGKTIQKRL